MSKGTVLVTGASSGIGEALAREFASHGYDLIITARRKDLLGRLADELGRDISVDTLPCDLATTDGPDALIASVDALGKPVDIVVNNAGLAVAGDFSATDQSQVETLVSVNMRAVALLTHHYLPIMIRRGAGRILNVASVGAFQPIPAMAMYAASKAFVLSLSEGIAEEVRGTGVSVTALCPGITRPDTDAATAQLPGFMVTRPDEVAREGYEALMAGETIRIPGIANQAAVTWSRLQPRWMTRALGGLVSRIVPGDYKV